ncbi:anti_SigH_actin, anti-sigma factor, TIGR02949 family [Candidatus Nanopelagicaceae bacterium]|jgi:mycothiol system anti-sigma-R factor
MSFNQFFNDKSTLACNEVLNSFVLLIEGSIEQPQIGLIEVHISTCPACEAELAHEQAVRQLMQETLRRSCNEKAPQDLHDSIYRQIHGQMAGTFTEVVTQYSMTEISIEIDEFGQIEHREVTIEHTEEIRFLNDSSDPNDPLNGGSNGRG